MSFNLILPKPGRYKKITKDLIILVLTEDHPLTIKQLSDKIRKRNDLSVTYAAIRKSAHELVRDKVLKQNGKTYELNSDWINEVCFFVNTIQQNYNTDFKPIKRVELDNGITVYNANNIYQAELVWGQILFNWAKNIGKGKHISTLQNYHFWILLFQLDRGLSTVTEMKKKNIEMYAAVYSNSNSTFLDKFTVKIYNKAGVPTKLIQDEKFKRGCKIGTYDDLVLQLYHPIGIAEEFDRIYNKVKKLNDLDLTKIAQLAKRDCPIKILVFKNAELANQIRGSLLKNFH